MILYKVVDEFTAGSRHDDSFQSILFAFTICRTLGERVVHFREDNPWQEPLFINPNGSGQSFGIRVLKATRVQSRYIVVKAEAARYVV